MQITEYHYSLLNGENVLLPVKNSQVQYGKCAVTGLPMEVHDIHCHHKMPSSKGGTDAYENLILISKAVHVIIHATSEITIREYLNPLQLDDSKLAKLNKLRTMAEMPVIIL